jgi:hypothetical protein
VIGLDSTGVRAVGEIELYGQVDAAGATEAAYQIGMLCAQAGDHAAGGPQRHCLIGKRHLRVERDQTSQESDSQETATGLRVGLPIHKHLSSPQASRCRLMVVTEMDRQHCVAIF